VLEKDKSIADAKLKIDAGKKQADGLLIDAALKLAAARKNRVISPVVIHARVNNVDAMQAQNIQNAFKAVLGPETAVSAIVDDKANAGKKQFDVAIGVDQAEIETQDSEFGIACVQQNVDCQILADVHKPLFDLVQTKAVVKAPAGNGGGNEYGAPNPHHGGAGEETAASSLFVAAGAVLAALAMFL
jgi:hypothetical protein